MYIIKGLAALAACLSIALADDATEDAFTRLNKAKANFFARKGMSTQAANPKVQKEPYHQFPADSSPYLNRHTRKYVVNPYSIPKVPFGIGESYAGNMPISDDPSNNRTLFFWFFPSSNPAASNEIAIWLNGGPGCSSLSGFLTENGVFTWMAGTKAPTMNPYNWVNLTNMVWVEQPIGVGYTTGEPDIKNEVQLAKEFMGFWKNFMTAFKLNNRDVYVTGESYGGFYVPYIANAFIESGDKEFYNVKGVSIVDPIIGDSDLQQEVPIVPYIDYWQNIFYLNDTFRERIHRANDRCGHTDYFNKYLQFPPPKGPFPKPTSFRVRGCDVIDSAYVAALEVNPCFNIYHILDTCPHTYGVLGIVNQGDYSPPGAQIYFDRPDVKKALNAPKDSVWRQCKSGVFVGGDRSPGPAQNGVLANVIEKTNNTIIGVGELDFLLPVNGTLLAIQNMTWNGKQGFQTPLAKQFYTPYHPEYNGGALAGAGLLGRFVRERGLTFYTVQLSGHMIPENAGGASYRQLELMLGRIPSLAARSDFTTQNGDFTGRTGLY